MVKFYSNVHESLEEKIKHLRIIIKQHRVTLLRKHQNKWKILIALLVDENRKKNTTDWEKLGGKRR